MKLKNMEKNKQSISRPMKGVHHQLSDAFLSFLGMVENLFKGDLSDKFI